MAMSKVENLLELFQEEKVVGVLSFLTIQNGLSGYVIGLNFLIYLHIHNMHTFFFNKTVMLLES